jgi:LacI family repressor for deo operon, udp, cdd, tsx, nupC, and nupG
MADEQRAGHVSMADVALRAGVSTATVSRSLRGSAVAPETRERVLQAARELRYVPSPAASQLASGRTGTVGVVVPFAARWFFSEVIAGAESVLRPAGLDLLLYDIGNAQARKRFFELLPLRRRVDAALVVASSLTDAQQDHLRGLGIPLCVLGSRLEGSPSVRIDDVRAGAVAARHLVGLGHQRLAMIGGDPDDPVGTATTARRREGFVSVLEEFGLDASLVVSEAWGSAGGARGMARLLSDTVAPTAVFAESDEIALGALRTLRAAGRSVPGRVSVVGVDDHELAAAVELTTVAQPVREQGAAAARALLEWLSGSGSADDTVLPTRLMVRHSTAPPAEGTAGGWAGQPSRQVPGSSPPSRQ